MKKILQVLGLFVVMMAALACLAWIVLQSGGFCPPWQQCVALVQ